MNFYSQAGQDKEVFSIYGSSGIFLDIGCNDPSFHNNTYALEMNGWTGLLLDIDPYMVSLCERVRSSDNSYVCGDITNIDLSKLLQESNIPQKIHYVSMDADSANKFLIENFPFKQYNVGFITFEHDLYRIGPELKIAATKILTSHGFELYKENVIAQGYGEFEDWWINKNF